MDPAVCLESVRDRINDGLLEEADVLLNAYQGWRSRGGFESYSGADKIAAAFRTIITERTK